LALIKDKLIKGINCPYWKIIDCNVKTGFVAIAPYVNQESAQVRENMMDGRTAFQIDFPIDVQNPLAYAYGKIKESKKQAIVLTPAVDEVKDAEGNVTQEAVPAVTEERETNWFADATDA
jgi:hypothetical protein